MEKIFDVTEAHQLQWALDKTRVEILVKIAL